MKASVIYRHRWLYEACMFLLYLGQYRERSRALAGLIPDHSSVVDVCCDPGTLYFDHLRKKASATPVWTSIRASLNGLLIAE
jgi:hypothetical protein